MCHHVETPPCSACYTGSCIGSAWAGHLLQLCYFLAKTLGLGLADKQLLACCYFGRARKEHLLALATPWGSRRYVTIAAIVLPFSFNGYNFSGVAVSRLASQFSVLLQVALVSDLKTVCRLACSRSFSC